jgi:hypothetical protein
MKKLLGIVVLGLLLSGNAFAKNIIIKCLAKNKDFSLILSFEDGGNWISIKGNKKVVGTNRNIVLGEEEVVTLKITEDKIEYMEMIASSETFMVIDINRVDGRMYQYGKILGGDRYDNYYTCEKIDRKF